MTEQTAACCCGALAITVKGEPERTIACHCDYCQRRTGTNSQVSSWYFKDQIVKEVGDYKVYQGPDNQSTEYRFCPTCGSTVYWYFSFLEGHSEMPVYGLAVGCFNDPEYPSPDIEIHTGNRHDWVTSIPGADSFHEFPPFERMLPKQNDPKSWRSEPRTLAAGVAKAQVVDSANEDIIGYEFAADVFEVSPSGARLSCDRLLDDCVLDLWITLNDEETKQHLSAELRWSSEDDTGTYELGVEIVNNPLTDIDHWCELVKALPDEL